MTWRREDYVKSQSETLFEHGWYDSAYEFAAEFKAWIGVDLDEPNVIICVDHEIKSKNLEVMLSVIRI